MRTLRWARKSGAIAGVLLLAACTARTEFATVWRAPKAQAPMTRLLVVAVTEDQATQRSFEDAFAAALNERGAEAAPGYMFLPSGEKLSKELIAEVLRTRGIQGVLITRLLKVDQEQHYVPPSTTVVPGGFYGGYYGYYRNSYDVVHTPGYWRTVRIVRLETRLYDASNGELEWAAQSNTFEPKSTDDTIKSVTRATADRLAKDALIGGS